MSFVNIVSQGGFFYGAWIRTQTHGSSFHGNFLLLLHHIYYRVGRIRLHFGRVGIFNPKHISCKFYCCHLHAKANAIESKFVLAGIFYCNYFSFYSVKSITRLTLSSYIKIELTSTIPSTFLANSITHICMQKQMPKKGSLFSRAYFTAIIFPSIPRNPKPGATSNPSSPCSFSETFSGVMNSLCTFTIWTLQSFIAPA